jgi:hypothetical protein
MPVHYSEAIAAAKLPPDLCPTNQRSLNHSVTSRFALRPLLNINFQPRLYDEECRVVLDGRLGVHKPESVPPQDLGQYFVHLQNGQVSPNAQVASTTELSHSSAFEGIN